MKLVQMKTWIIVAVLWSASLAEKKECNFSVDKMLPDDEVLAKATSTMWNSFETSCESTSSCIFEHEPVQARTHLDYGAMRDSENYIASRKACKELGTEDAPSSFCHVNSELHVSNGETGSKLVIDKFFAKKEPVCFPYQCGNGQWGKAHPKPLGCDPDTTTCSILNVQVDCPNRPEGVGNGNCIKVAAEFAQDSAYNEAKDLLNAEVGTHCMDNLVDIDNSICVSTTEPIGITLMQNFRKFEKSNDYKTFKDACYGVGGDLCYMSLTAKIEGELLFFNIDLSGDYNDYPMCFPSVCGAEDRMKIQTERIGNDLSEKVEHSIKIRGNDRRLGEDVIAALDEEIEKRSLQIDEPYCPIKGMDKCAIVVADYYCTMRDGSTVQEDSLLTSFATVSRPSSLVFSTLLAIVGGMML